ncbi:MAG: hypothetical protein WA809_00530 [Candidatus Dormiibacterota bacterium]
MSRKTRPILVTLIGTPAFRYCVRLRRYANSLGLILLVGVGALLGAVIGVGTSQLAFAGLWGACVLYCVFGLPVLIVWKQLSTQLASRKLSDELGYPIRIRGAGGSLDVNTWKRAIDRALQRSRDTKRGG